MDVLLVILVPLAALFTLAIVFDLRRRGLRGAPRRNEISVARARANADARRSRYMGGGAGFGGTGSGKEATKRTMGR
jgi:hypothetical protein